MFHGVQINLPFLHVTASGGHWTIEIVKTIWHFTVSLCFFQHCILYNVTCCVTCLLLDIYFVHLPQLFNNTRVFFTSLFIPIVFDNTM